MQPKPGQMATRLASALLPTAVLSLCALSAHAQSSLTLYGRADLSVESVKGTTSVTRVTSGNLTGSRLGVRGTEDLGDGIKAKFNLETGVRFDTGANNGASARFWDRQAWVGLGSNTLGELRLGRTDSALGTIVDRIGTQSYDDMTLVGSRGANSYRRMDNSITYDMPAVVPGLSAQLQYSLAAAGFDTAGKLASGNTGAETSGTEAGKVWSGYVAYTMGPANAAVAYLRSADENNLTSGKQTAQAAFALAGWDFGPAKLTGYYNVETGAGSDRLVTLGARVGVPVTPALMVMGGISSTKGTTAAVNDDDKVMIYTLKGEYSLSKRTSVYGWLVSIDNDTAANKGVVTTAAGATGQGIAIGMKHLF